MPVMTQNVLARIGLSFIARRKYHSFIRNMFHLTFPVSTEVESEILSRSCFVYIHHFQTARFRCRHHFISASDHYIIVDAHTRAIWYSWISFVSMRVPAIHKTASTHKTQPMVNILHRILTLVLILCRFCSIPRSILLHTQFLWENKNFAFVSPSRWSRRRVCIWCVGEELNWKSWNRLIVHFYLAKWANIIEAYVLGK